MSDLHKFPLCISIKPIDDEDECAVGGEHEPETEYDELTTEFWGNIQTTKFQITSCAKCGELCRPKEYDDD
jgi:hypothetical protein